MRKLRIICIFCLCTLTSLGCFAQLKKTNLKELQYETLLSLLDGLSADQQLYLMTIRQNYLTKVEQTEQYVFLPLKSMQLHRLNEILEDTTWNSGEREIMIRERVKKCKEIVPLVLYADSLLNQKYDENNINSITKLLMSYTNDTLLLPNQVTSIKNLVDLLNSYQFENGKFKSAFILDTNTQRTYEKIKKINNPASSLVKAFIYNQLIPYWNNQTTLPSFRDSKIPYIQQAYKEFQIKLNNLQQEEKVTLKQVNDLFIYINKL